MLLIGLVIHLLTFIIVFPIRLIAWLLKLVFYMVIGLGTAIIESLRYMVKGKSVFAKFLLLLIYGGIIAAAILNRHLFFIILYVILGIDMLFSIYCMNLGKGEKTEEKTTEHTQEERSKDADAGRIRIEGFNTKDLFSGLNPDEAKRKYRQLMKRYHPDSAGGDEQKAKMVTEEFERYKKRH